MYKKSFKNKINLLAFTLAEVLITLGIIGVVAALTIPNLMKNFQNVQYVSGLKKAYTIGTQALKSLTADMGCADDIVCTGLFGSTIPISTFGNEYVKYFRIAKNCKTSSDLGCWSSKTYTYYDGSNKDAYYQNDAGGSNSYTFLTADGMSIFLKSNSLDGCSSPTYSNNRTNDMTVACGELRVDINGPKEPNLLGRDAFWFFITNGNGLKLYPCGGSDDKHGGSDYWWESGYCKGNDKRGPFCAGRIIESGWIMDY